LLRLEQQFSRNRPKTIVPVLPLETQEVKDRTRSDVRDGHYQGFYQAM
jgi:hypothetical protein